MFKTQAHWHVIVEARDLGEYSAIHNGFQTLNSRSGPVNLTSRPLEEGRLLIAVNAQ